uniref:Transmembrane protein n=1 Tax=Glossina pallidipes TaxID=7398 RepID=A0A1B0A0V4_GLOPL
MQIKQQHFMAQKRNIEFQLTMSYIGDVYKSQQNFLNGVSGCGANLRQIQSQYYSCIFVIFMSETLMIIFSVRKAKR